MVLSLLLALAALPAAPQAPEDPGPHLAGWRDVVFQDAIFGQGTIRGRIYYPATAAGQGAPPDPAAGPYPLAGFQHGWLGRPSSYDALCLHLASWGFVVASTGTETGLFPDTYQYARDTRSLLHWTEQQGAAALSWLSGMVAQGGDWPVVGHSMGGGTLSLLIGIEPRVRTIVGLQAAATDAYGNANVAAFTGRAYWIAGSVDWVVPSATVHAWFDRARAAERNVFWEIQGMGHVGCTDTPGSGDPLPGAEQHRLHRRLVAGLLRADVRGEEDLWRELIGQGFAAEPSRQQSRCALPPLWAVPDPAGAALDTGLAALPNQPALLAWSLVPDQVPTAYGLLGLSPPDLSVYFQARLAGEGTALVPLPLAASWSGHTLYVQGLGLHPGGGGALSRTAAVPVP